MIERETLASPSTETGGILVGHVDGPLTFRVTAASGPGPNARRTPTHFLRDTAYCAVFLQEQYEAHGADYLGDWHSHLRGVASNELSSGDFITLLQTINDPDYADLPGFVNILTFYNGGFSSKRRLLPANPAMDVNPTPKATLTGFIAMRDYIVELPIEKP